MAQSENVATLPLRVHHVDNEARAQAFCMQTRAFRDAYEAFTRKRPAKFIGR